MQPYNYNVQQFDPIGSAIKGVQTGQMMNQASQARELQNQRAAQAMQTTNLKNQKVMQTMQMQQDLAKFAAKEDGTADDLVKVMTKYPDAAKDLEKALEHLTYKEKKARESNALELNHLGKRDKKKYIERMKKDAQVLLESDSKELVEKGKVKMLLAESAENELKAGKDLDKFVDIQTMGDIGLESFKKYVDSGEVMARTDKTQKEVDFYDEVTESQIGYQKALTDKTQKEADFYGDKFALEAEKVANETNRIISDALKEKNKMKGVFSPEKKLDLRLKLSNQYLKEGGEKYASVKRGYDMLMNASATGVGGLTTILAYMKMIDPSSTVTGSEVLTAKKAPSGWSEPMIRLYNDSLEGGRMTETAEKQFKAEAKNMLMSAKKRADATRTRLTKSAKELGLDVGKIFNPIKEEKKSNNTLDLSQSKAQSNLIGGDKPILPSNGNLEQSKKINRAANFLKQFEN